MSESETVRKRNPATFDRGLFVEGVAAAEKGGRLPSRAALLRAVAAHYNANRADGLAAITPSRVAVLLKEWDVPHLSTPATEPGSRLTPCDRDLLLEGIAAAEKGGPCQNQTVMLHAVAAYYNDRRGDKPPITYVVVRLRIGTWGLEHQTPPRIKPLNRSSSR